MQGDSLDYTWKEAKQDMLKGMLWTFQAIGWAVAAYYIILL